MLPFTSYNALASFNFRRAMSNLTKSVSFSSAASPNLMLHKCILIMKVNDLPRCALRSELVVPSLSAK